MKDANDPGTAELPLAVKRGRGRPRKPDALTPAERQRRYRARRVLVPFDRLGVSDAQYDDLVRERDDLRSEIERWKLACKRQVAAQAQLRVAFEQLQRQYDALSGKSDVTKKGRKA